MLRIYNQVKTKVIFAVKRTLFAIEFAKVERRICVQRPNALILPEGHRTINTFMPPDVYKFELKTLTIEICRQGQYVAVCKGCPHVICVHNSVGIIATGSSPVSGLGPKPFKVITPDQVRMPVWVIAADCFSVVRKKNILEIKIFLSLSWNHLCLWPRNLGYFKFYQFNIFMYLFTCLM